MVKKVDSQLMHQTMTPHSVYSALQAYAYFYYRWSMSAAMDSNRHPLLNGPLRVHVSPFALAIYRAVLEITAHNLLFPEQTGS